MAVTKNKKIYLLTFVIILVVANLVVGLVMVSVGNKINGLEKERREIAKINQTLRDNLVENSSFTVLAEKAEGIGYAKVEDKMYITGNDTVVASAR